MENWRGFFAPWILERGYNYFLDGHVTKVDKDDNCYIGTVSGTEDYSVEIYYSNNPFEDEFHMNCTCPYADDESNCKHMAALLYAIEVSEDYGNNISDCDNDIRISDSEKSAKVLNETLELLAAEVIKSELQKILIADENLRAVFLAKYVRDERSIADYIKSMKNTAWSIQRECSDRHGFVNWRNASTYTLRLINEVLSNLEDILSDEIEEAQTVFDVSLYVLDMFTMTDIDDDGDTQLITGECIELWEKVLANNKSETLGKHMFDELLKFCDKIGLGEYISVEIDNFISDNFNEGRFINDRIEVLDRRIKCFEDSDRWNTAQVLSQSVMERLDLMSKLEKSESEIEVFKNSYWHLPPVRDAKMRELETLKDWENLISLLEESKEIDKDSFSLVGKHFRKLVDVYKMIGDTEKAKNELYTYVLNYSRGDVNVFCELRSYYHEVEWIDIREDIFQCLEDKHVDIKPLLAEEKLKGRLMYLLVERYEKNRGMGKWFLPELARFENHLRPEFENELLDFYEEIIMKVAEYAGGRDYYRDIVSACQRMFAYPGGNERVQEMVEKWLIMYYNRPAMKQELQSLK